MNSLKIMNPLKFHVLILLLFFSLYSSSLKAQVTIGSGTAPHKDALLDLKEETDGSSEKGLLLPRVTLSETTDFSPLSEHVEGMVVYNTATVGDVVPGYYYNDGTKWILLGSAGSGSNSWQVAGSAVSATDNTDNIYQMGSVAVGYGGTADPSAIFNVNSDNKGVLLPRVTLTGPTDVTTINNPTLGLLIYNTGADTDFPFPGYMFWDGAQWKIFGSSTSKRASAVLNCAGATMSPTQQIKNGVPIIEGTVIQVPYTGGNGGYIKGVTLNALLNGAVTATISDGVLSEGNGVLNFALSGIPTLNQEAPNGIIFNITDFITANPDISDGGYILIRVGDGKATAIEVSSAVMGYLALTNDGNYALQCDSPDGKFSVRVRLPSSFTSVAWGNQSLNIQVRNNGSSPVSAIWNAMYDFGIAAPFGTAGIMTMPSNQWGGATHVDAVPTAWGDIWGQPGIYDSTGRGPEYRRYTWVPMGASNKVAYEITVMAALDTMNPDAPVHPTNLKAYIRFQQIIAL